MAKYKGSGMLTGFRGHIGYHSEKGNNKFISHNPWSTAKLDAFERGEEVEVTDEQEIEEPESDEPADSPPIRAGSGQDLSEIRKRVRSLMSLR